jgi:hypothetical protein
MGDPFDSQNITGIAIRVEATTCIIAGIETRCSQSSPFSLAQ